MAISYRNGSTAGNASGGNLTIDKPTNTADGDILIAVCYNEISGSAWTAPAGWAQWGTGQVSKDNFAWQNIYWKRASSEGANYTFNIATTWRIIVMAAFSGALASGDPLDVGPTGNKAATSEITPIALSITTTVADTMRVAGHGNYSGDNVAGAGTSGMTQGPFLGGCEGWYVIQASSGASGNKSFSDFPSGHVYWITYHLAIKIASGGTNGTVTAVVAEAPAAAGVPTVTGARNPTVTAVVANSPAAMLAPTVTGATNGTVIAVLAAAPAAMPAPTVTGVQSPTVTAVIAAAPAAMPAPAVSGVQSPTVIAVIAAAPAAMLAPTVSAGINGDVTAVVAAAPAAMLAPTVTAAINGTVVATIAASPAAMLAPTVTGNAAVNGDVTAVVAAAPAAAPTPGVFAITTNHEISVGDGYTDGTPQQIVITSDSRIWVASWKFDTYNYGPAGGMGQTLRMYKANQTGIPSTFSRMDSSNEPTNPTTWAIAVDGNDLIHVIWMERASWEGPNYGTIQNVNYCTFNTALGTWGTPATIDNALGVTNDFGQGDETASLALDTNGVPHIVYCKYDGTRRRVTYRNKIGGSWSAAETVDDQSFGAGQYIHHPGIVFDQNGNRVVSWIRGAQELQTDGRAFVRVYSGGAWGTTVDISGADMWPGIDTALRVYVDANNRYHTAFLDTSKQIAYYYSDNAGASWTANHPGGGTALGDNPVVGPWFGGQVRLYAHNDPTTDTRITYYQGHGGSLSWGSRTVYNTTTGMDCTVNIAYARYFNQTSFVAVAYWQATYSPGTNALYIGVDLAAQVGSVNAVTAAAPAAMPTPTVTGARSETVIAVVAAAPAAMLAPAVSGIAVTHGDVTAVVAAAPATMLVPTVSATRSETVLAVIAAAPAAMLAPTVTGILSPTVLAVIMVAVAAMLPPIVGEIKPNYRHVCYILYRDKVCLVVIRDKRNYVMVGDNRFTEEL